MDSSNSSACKFCLTGAIQRAIHDSGEGIGLYFDCRDWICTHVNLRITKHERDFPLVAFNDAPHRTHADVLRAIDEAIQPFLEE